MVNWNYEDGQNFLHFVQRSMQFHFFPLFARSEFCLSASLAEWKDLRNWRIFECMAVYKHLPDYLSGCMRQNRLAIYFPV